MSPPAADLKIAPAPPRVVVDARMLRFSGIGVYIENLLAQFTALGIPFQSAAHEGEPDYDFTARVYSISEQLAFRRLGVPAGAVWWSPHYNVPVLHRGALVATIHDLAHLALPRFFPALSKKLYSRFMFSTVARKARSIICVSRFTADEMIRLTGADARKIHVIHNGIDESWFEESRGESPAARPYVLCVGNVKPHKNIQALIRAFGEIQSEREVDLVIVGRKEGFLAGDSAVLETAGVLEGRVHFTGLVSEELLRRYYAHAEALVFPSLYEGFGFPPLEAMASGCPAVVSRAASMPEVCGDAAIYCDPLSVEDIADKIKLALDLRGQERVRFLANARAHARRFGWERCARETWEVLRHAGA